MKKLNVLMAVMAVAVLASCGGTGSGKVTMKDVKDTISYSIGMGRAVRVYKDQLPYEIVDSVTIKSFVKGFLDAAKDPEDKAKLAYALGFEIGCQEMSQAFVGLSENLFGTGEEFNKSNYVSGFSDGMLDNWKIMTFDEADETSNRLYEYLTQKQFDKVREENAAFLEAKAKEKDVVKTPSGLLYQVIKLGDGGPKPTATSDVEVRYRGELIDGKVFDESKNPITLNLSGVISGWTEGLQLMSVGDKYRFFIPYNLAYGEQGAGNDIKPYSTLIFEVELVNIK
ncbi:MAG: FKBP-type peptidyl-prolyl cis-trans isomerase [Bacteroidaceae bacterium]|nr:FKBP-type peptidyl-prolyl cis-trans isomerase [Bacteroidaceae bacterium]